MVTTTLKHLFAPSSVALVGASSTPSKMGSSVMRNLLSGGFRGPLLPVNPKYSSVHGVLCYRDVASLPIPPDLAIICTPPNTVKGVIEALVCMGTGVSVVLTADPEGGAPDTKLKREILAAAAGRMRVVGPGSIGVLIPGIGLNGTWASAGFKPGRVALVSQSGAVAQSVIHWGESHGVGFSHVFSTGDSIDVTMGELVEHLAEDPTARSILLYLQKLTDARRFLSGARAAAKLKHVIVIRSGRRNRYFSEISGDGAPSVPVDLIFESAFRRTGLLRVLDLDELLDAVENLTYGKPLLGEKLLIVSNGAGTAETAADVHVLGGGIMAEISPATADKLKALLPRRCLIENPLDLGRDADPERYQKALEVLITAEGINALLVMHTPTDVSHQLDVARVVVETTWRSQRNVLACLFGGETTSPAHTLCQNSGIPVFSTPDKAARAFLHMVRFRRTQELLTQTPSAPPTETEGRLEVTGELLEGARCAGRALLDEAETSRLLNAYGITCEPIRLAEDAASAVRASTELGFPVALKLASPTLLRTQETGGVVLGLNTPQAVREAATALLASHGDQGSGAPFPGLVIQRRIWKPRAVLFSAGIAVDPVFGPVIYLGHGGAAAKSSREMAVGLPPLNMKLAEELASDLKSVELSQWSGPERQALKAALAGFLVRLSHLVEEVGELAALEINPLLVDAEGVLAVDSRALVTFDPRPRFAIRPYPGELVEEVTTRTGLPVQLRPVRAEDEEDYREFLSRISNEDLRKRFFSEMKNLSKAQLSNMTSLDFEREMAIVAVATVGGVKSIIGVVQIRQSIDNRDAEYAIIVRSDMKGQGLGRILMEKIIAYAQSRGVAAVSGIVLKSNIGMLKLCDQLGFCANPFDDDDIVGVRLGL